MLEGGGVLGRMHAIDPEGRDLPVDGLMIDVSDIDLLRAQTLLQQAR